MFGLTAVVFDILALADIYLVLIINFVQKIVFVVSMCYTFGYIKGSTNTPTNQSVKIKFCFWFCLYGNGISKIVVLY